MYCCTFLHSAVGDVRLVAQNQPWWQHNHAPLSDGNTFWDKCIVMQFCCVTITECANDPWTTWGLGAPTPHAVKHLCVTFDSAVSPSHLCIPLTVNEKFDLWLGPRSWECKNVVFSLWLVEFMDVKPADKKSSLYLLEKKCTISGPGQFKLVLFKVQLYLHKPTWYSLSLPLYVLYFHKIGRAVDLLTPASP